MNTPTGNEAELEFDQACYTVERDADFIATAPASLIARNLPWIEEARERLNDALAKVRKAA